MKNLFRKNILEMSGYVPGEQPKKKNIVKLNTNENPYPPSPKIKKFLANYDISKLRLYPDPLCDQLRTLLAAKFAVKSKNIIIGNGSDDILNLIVRACCDESKRTLACFEPSYSLYPVLAQIQGANCIKIPLSEKFEIPENIPENAFNAALFMITRPNAPTSNTFPKKTINRICDQSSGIVLIDEAYADFADDNCVDLLKKHKNLIICRTLSKSYSLAGIRLGFAIANEEIISQMMKVKDSYNVCRLTQEIAKIAIADERHFKNNIQKIKNSRQKLIAKLRKIGFYVIDSQTNFIFTSPPENCEKSAENIFTELRHKKIFVRYFKGKLTNKFLRITIGTENENNKLISNLQKIINS